MSKEKKLYYCDADKNIECSKNSCYIYNKIDGCFLTSNKKYEAIGVSKLLLFIKFGKEDRVFNKIKKGKLCE